MRTDGVATGDSKTAAELQQILEDEAMRHYNALAQEEDTEAESIRRGWSILYVIISRRKGTVDDMAVRYPVGFG